MKHCVVIKNLKNPNQYVIVSEHASNRDASAAMQRFLQVKWSLRRPQVYTIGDVALMIDVIRGDVRS